MNYAEKMQKTQAEKKASKDKKAKIGLILMKIGLILMVFANVVGIGYGLFLWGSQGVVFSLAVWTAFKVWISMIISGVFLWIFPLVKMI